MVTIVTAQVVISQNRLLESLREQAINEDCSKKEAERDHNHLFEERLLVKPIAIDEDLLAMIKGVIKKRGIFLTKLIKKHNRGEDHQGQKEPQDALKQNKRTRRANKVRIEKHQEVT